jgi:hypothetical protein
MGRKEGQRTKGNTKPSSSARSADLLNSNLTSNIDIQSNYQRGLSNGSLPVLGMGGISGLGDDLAEAALPGELKQTMKKMSKKDTTTKLKALQDFADYINNAQINCSIAESTEKENIKSNEEKELDLQEITPFFHFGRDCTLSYQMTMTGVLEKLPIRRIYTLSLRLEEILHHFCVRYLPPGTLAVLIAMLRQQVLLIRPSMWCFHPRKSQTQLIIQKRISTGKPFYSVQMKF